MIGFLLLAIVPYSEVTTDHVDSCEFNHYYDEQGRHVFDQAIYRRWNGEDFAIVDWRLIRSPNQTTGRKAIWYDGNCLRKVTANHVYHTWTQYDPELCERNEHPKENRRELTPATITTRRAKELIDHGSNP